MVGRTLTSANSILTLAIPRLFDTPQLLQGFAVEAISDSDSINPAETMMGVDGIFSAGWVPVPIAQNYNIQGDSKTIDLFERWYQTQQQIREVLPANGLIVIPSLQVKYTCTKGILSGYVPTAVLGKVVGPRKFTVTWQSVTRAPV